MKQRLVLVILSTVIVSLLCACQSSVDDSILGTSDLNTNQYQVGILPETEDIISVSGNLTTIDEYVQDFSSDVENVRNGEYSRLNIGSCVFIDLPTFENIGIYNYANQDITPEQSYQIIEQWIESIDAEINLDSELRDASGQYESSDNEYPYDYPAVSDYFPNFTSGGGFFINTDVCYIQMGGNNIYSMSNGVISSYINSEGFAAADALGSNSENVVLEGNYNDLSNQSFLTANGIISVEDAAINVISYFENGTPVSGPEGMSVDIPYVRVFALDDIYGYAFNVRRVFNGIPFSYSDFGVVYSYYGNYQIVEDIKIAYTIDGEVDAYTGYSQGIDLITICEIDQIKPVSIAICDLDNYVANQANLRVDEVALEYVPITDNNETYLLMPCWRIDTFNNSDGVNIRFFVSAITDDIYFYTYA